MNSIIVTGVNGFVGGHLVNELLAQGYDVVGVGREEQPSPDVTDKLSAYYACDLADYESVKKLPLTEMKAVINLAGLAAVGPSFDDPELYMRINTAVLDTVCKAALEQGAKNLRVLSISSGAIYGSDQPMPLTEDSLLAPESSPYAASKIAMERLSLDYREQGLDCIVARPFNHIGPGQLEGFLLPDLYKKVTESQATGSPLLVGNLTTKRDYTDVRDVVKAYVKLIASQDLRHGIYNVCTGKSVGGEEILSKLVAELQAEGTEQKVDKSMFRPSDTPELYGDNTRLKADTGWEPQISVDQTIADYVSWAKTR